MSVTVVTGGQFGSEGKGKVSCFFAEKHGCSVAVRVGGPNSGHTVVDRSGTVRIFRHLPTAAILPDTLCVIPAGAYVDVDVLFREMLDVDLLPERLLIDKNAVIVSNEHKEAEREWGLRQGIGSTATGTGAAVISRIRRDGAVRLASNDERLTPFVANTRSILRQRIKQGERILVEGTQGFGLSVLHAEDYPFATSRDTTAAGFISEAGLSPLDVDEVVMVIRAFPIRVPGNSGPLPKEIEWSDIARTSGGDPVEERTSVTNCIRRIAQFDPRVVREAIETNQPTKLVLNHVDYIDAACADLSSLTPKAARFVRELETSLDRSLDYVGFDRKTIYTPSECQRSMPNNKASARI